jgi:predicted nuclease of restriction endonuclease-like (RecB) superfamily
MMLMRDADLVLPAGYAELLADLKREVLAAQRRAHQVVNAEMLGLYWKIGAAILERQDQQGWGARVIDRLALDLRAAFPQMRGFSRTNLYSMRAFAGAWSLEAIVQTLSGRLTWSHVTLLLNTLSEHATRQWYAAQAIEHGWSVNILRHQIKGSLHLRVGAAASNFPAHLAPPDSELAQQLAKDPYVFDFLGLSDQVAERDLEQALMDRLQDFLLELGRGFSFVGRQVHFEVDGDDFYVDLLFFHVEQLRYVVVELKVGKFAPEHAGQLGFYVELVDDRLRRATHAPTVGLLLCAARNERVVRYSLGAATKPMAVATYTYETLPSRERQQLPDAKELAAIFDAPVAYRGQQMTISEYIDTVQDPHETT